MAQNIEPRKNSHIEGEFAFLVEHGFVLGFDVMDTGSSVHHSLGRHEKSASRLEIPHLVLKL